jgi:hypothetical protein
MTLSPSHPVYTFKSEDFKKKKRKYAFEHASPKLTVLRNSSYILNYLFTIEKNWGRGGENPYIRKNFLSKLKSLIY